MKTLIVSGCSYTNYRYDTWGEHLSKYFKKYKNLGKPGSGPKFSYLQIIDYIYSQNKKDLSDHTIIVQWSSLKRHDLVTLVEPYLFGGQIDNNSNFDDEFIHKFFSIEEKAIDLINFIDHLILLSFKYKFQLYMFYMFEPWIGDFAGEPVSPELFEPYKYKLDQFRNSKSFKILKDLYYDEYWIKPSLESFALANEMRGAHHTVEHRNGYEIIPDSHPTTEQHKLYTELIVDKLQLKKIL
jgi:hypothetical protein